MNNTVSCGKPTSKRRLMLLLIRLQADTRPLVNKKEVFSGLLDHPGDARYKVGYCIYVYWKKRGDSLGISIILILENVLAVTNNYIIAGNMQPICIREKNPRRWKLFLQSSVFRTSGIWVGEWQCFAKVLHHFSRISFPRMCFLPTILTQPLSVF